MSGLRSDTGWDEGRERSRWHRAGSDLVLVAAGVSWTTLWVASYLASPICLALGLRSRPADEAGDDL
jgi:hypothetical protein